MAKSSRRSAQVGSSRRISSSRFRLTNAATKPTPISVPDAPFKDRPPGTDQPEAASRQDLELRLEGQRLGCLRDGILSAAIQNSGILTVLRAFERRFGRVGLEITTCGGVRC